MKTKWSKLLSIAVLTITTVGIWGTRPLPVPPAPAFTPITAEQIDKEVRTERVTREINRQAAIAEKVFEQHRCHLAHADLVARYAMKHHIPIRLLAAVILVESKGKENAVYGGTDIGLMQINSRVWKYSKVQLLDPEFNLKVGTRILGGYIHSYGFVEGLHHYNGMGNSSNDYATQVYKIAGMQMPAVNANG